MYDYDNYEDAPLDELVYGRCKICHQLEELNEDDTCLTCEGYEHERKPYQRTR